MERILFCKLWGGRKLGKDLGMLGLAAVAVFGIWKAFDLTDKWLEQKEFENLIERLSF